MLLASTGAAANVGRRKAVLAGWFLAGCGLMLAFQAGFVWRHGGDWTVLMRVGSEKPHQAHIERELGPVACLDALGHDGPINYLIARDPLCRRDTAAVLGAFDNPPYRYRRILYPLLAGGCGWAPPRAVFVGLIFWAVVGGGLVAAAAADLCPRGDRAHLALLLVLLNPGVYLAAQVLTADTLAAGLALSGVALWRRGRPWSAAGALAAAALVRETSLLIGLALALELLAQRRPRPAVLLAAASGLPWLAWSLWVRAHVPGGDGLDNFNLPFAGILRSIPVWRALGPEYVLTGGLALLLTAAGAVVAWRTGDHFLRYSCLTWAGLAVALSVDVWGQPGNAVRALAPLWVFVALGYACQPAAQARDKKTLACAAGWQESVTA